MAEHLKIVKEPAVHEFADKFMKFSDAVYDLVKVALTEKQGVGAMNDNLHQRMVNRW